MIIIGSVSFPPQSAKEFGKLFLKVPPAPEYVTIKGTYLNSSTVEGVKGFTIYEFDPSNYTEASEYIRSRYVIYFDVPGYKYSIEVWMEPQEALQTIGLA